jgi:hypothetical protein
MATTKSKPEDEGGESKAAKTEDVGAKTAQQEIDERKRRKTEATTVVGDESFPPPGMDLPDGGVVPLEEESSA